MALEATAGTKAIPRRRDRDPIVVWSDEQLLQRFLSRSDESAEAAFATLIERHGPIVHRVCLDVFTPSGGGSGRGAGGVPRPGPQSRFDSQARVARPLAARGRATPCPTRPDRRGPPKSRGAKERARSCASDSTRKQGPIPWATPNCTRKSIDSPRNTGDRSSSVTCRGGPRCRPLRHSAGHSGRCRSACTAAGTGCGRG